MIILLSLLLILAGYSNTQNTLFYPDYEISQVAKFSSPAGNESSEYLSIKCDLSLSSVKKCSFVSSSDLARIVAPRSLPVRNPVVLREGLDDVND